MEVVLDGFCFFSKVGRKVICLEWGRYGWEWGMKNVEKCWNIFFFFERKKIYSLERYKILRFWGIRCLKMRLGNKSLVDFMVIFL